MWNDTDIPLGYLKRLKSVPSASADGTDSTAHVNSLTHPLTRMVLTELLCYTPFGSPPPGIWPGPNAPQLSSKMQ
jgi:hypothetical protein